VEHLTQQEADKLAQHVLAGCRPTMAVVIGDRTPRQYDRADQMAEGIVRAVGRALVKMDLLPEEA
jgi:hypothetical protein